MVEGRPISGREIELLTTGPWYEHHFDSLLTQNGSLRVGNTEV